MMRFWLYTAAVTMAFLSPIVRIAREKPTARVSLGVTVLIEDSLHLIRGKRVGLITNQTGRDDRGRSTIDLIHGAPDVRLTALFSPEHGIRGTIVGGRRVSSTVDEKTGVPIFSLYGETLVPTVKMLENIDVLIYDIQDVGARMYTYVWTMTLAAEVAKEAGKRFIILDRPNPIRADIVEGGFIERRYRSFTGLHDVPLRYGLTPGELALYLVGTKQLDAEVTVIPMRGYRRSMWWSDADLDWVTPSPNIRDPETALLYPGIGLFEATNVSEGRGTSTPLKIVGARWLTDAPAIVRALNAKGLPGVRFEATFRFIARGEKFGGQKIPMIRVMVTNRDELRAADLGVHMLREIYIRHPRDFRWQEQGIERLSGSRALRNAVEHGGIDALLSEWKKESARFREESARYFLYQP